MIKQLTVHSSQFTRYLSCLSTLLFALLLPTQFGKHFWPDYTYLHGVKIDYLAPFIGIFDLVCFGIILISLQTSELKKVRLLLNKILDLKTVGLTILLLLTINIFASFSPFVTIFKITKICLYIAASYFVLKNAKNNLNALFYGLFVSTLLVFILAVWQFLTKSSAGGLWYFLGEREITLSLPGIAKMAYGGKEFLRPYSTFSHPNSMGGFYLTIFFLIDWLQQKISVMLPARRNHDEGGSPPKYDALSKLSLQVTQLLSLFIVILSLSKVAIGSFVLISFIKLINDKAYKGCIICFAARTSIFVFLLFFIFFFSGDPYTLDKRLFLTTQSLEIIKNNLLFGVGIGTSIVAQSQLTSAIPGKFTDTLQPVHNIYLLFVSELGLLGTALMGVAIYLKRIIFVDWQKLPLAAISAILITGLFDHYWLTLPQNIALMCLILSIIILSSRDCRDSSH